MAVRKKDGWEAGASRHKLEIQGWAGALRHELERSQVSHCFQVSPFSEMISLSGRDSRRALGGIWRNCVVVTSLPGESTDEGCSVGCTRACHGDFGVWKEWA